MKKKQITFYESFRLKIQCNWKIDIERWKKFNGRIWYHKRLYYEC